jgi:hypothetical protein
MANRVLTEPRRMHVRLIRAHQGLEVGACEPGIRSRGRIVTSTR